MINRALEISDIGEKIPPYGRQLMSILSNRSCWIKVSGGTLTGLSIYCLVGSGAWNKAENMKKKHSFVLLPYGADPLGFNWGLLKGHDPIHILPTGDITLDEMQSLAEAMDRDGVNRILYSRGNRTAFRYLSHRVIEVDE